MLGLGGTVLGAIARALKHRRDFHQIVTGPGAVPSHCPSQQVSDTELFTNLSGRLARIRVALRALPPDQFKSGQLAEPTGYLLRHSVGKIGIVRIAKVFERKHRERWRALSDNRGSHR